MELTVGHGAKPRILLFAHYAAYRIVFYAAQLLGRDPTGGEVLAGPQELGRAEQVPDVICTERWRVTHRSGSSSVIKRNN